jgi:hypothetical protein
MNTYSYVYNNPLKYIDPTGLDAIVTLYQGQGGNIFNHIGVGTTTGLNANQTFGAGPNTGSGIGFPSATQGHVGLDTGQPLRTVTIPTTPEQDAIINRYNLDAVNNQNSYQLIGESCVNHVRDALTTAGISLPTRSNTGYWSGQTTTTTIGDSTVLPNQLFDALSRLGTVTTHAP